MIEFESVSKTFPGGTHAVQDLSLTIPSDKITVIVGPSGCGKTTTLRMVNRMLEPSKGRITWDGTPLKSRRKTTVRRQMGYVIQSGGLFPHRTVLENIGTVPGLLGWGKDKTRKRSLELLGNVGLDRRMAERYPGQLSGGQQQRVGVARALAADPLVMLMDEPFSAVDPVVRAELHEFFLGLQRQISKTIVLITHDIEEAIKLGDQVVILRVGGRLAQAGPPQELLDEPADAFVEGFVGRDRGYRSLSFLPATGLSLGEVAVVREAASGGDGGPTLVLDGDARPVGWVDEDKPGLVHPIGSTFVRDSDNLRAALDSALTSPYAIAVAIDGETGRYTGVATADEILDQVRRRREGVGPGSVTVEAAEAREHELAAGTASTVAASSEDAAAEEAAAEGTPAEDTPVVDAREGAGEGRVGDARVEAASEATRDASGAVPVGSEPDTATEARGGTPDEVDATDDSLTRDDRAVETELAPGGATAAGLGDAGRSWPIAAEPETAADEPARSEDVEHDHGHGAESLRDDDRADDARPLAEDEQPTEVRPVVMPGSTADGGTADDDTSDVGTAYDERAYDSTAPDVHEDGASDDGAIQDGPSQQHQGTEIGAATGEGEGEQAPTADEDEAATTRTRSVRYWTPRSLPRDPEDRG